MTLHTDERLMEGPGVRPTSDPPPQGQDIAETDPISAEGPDLAELMSAFTGVTERLQDAHQVLQAEVRRLKNQLRETNEQLRRSQQLAALGQMAAGIAHEIRNPLGSIRLYATMLAEDVGDRPEAHQLARRIEQAVRDLDGIVCDVLDFSREIRIQAVDLKVNEIFENAIESCRDLLHESRIRIERPRSADDDSPETIQADPVLINQVLVNLIRNALEAMGDEGTLTLHATLEATPPSDDDDIAEERGRRHVLSVRDTGPGFDEAKIDRIFNPFFTTRQTGTGLGLAIVHRIVDAHRGTIEIANHPAGGAEVRVGLPAANAAGAESNQQTPAGDTSSSTSEHDRDEGLAA